MAQRVFDIFTERVQPASPSLESGLFKQLIDKADSDPSSAGHGSCNVGCFHSTFCCCSGRRFLANIPSCFIYALLTDRWVISPQLLQGICLSIPSVVSVLSPMCFDTLLSDT